MDSGDMFPERGKIAFVDGETSYAMSKNDYEVFLSFRGPDTRQGFTDCLYHALVDSGIGVFRDDDELQPGDKIDDILHALNNSKICIVVLSPTFAESAWCLREVERMVDKKKDIVPIFYRVTPDDVKLKTGSYASALTVHEAKYGKDTVQQWREALKEIPKIKGRELKNTGYGEFSKQVAKEILTKLKVKFKYEIKNLVEVPDEVESALEMLDIGSGGRRVVGIHGMGGIGKTTLAKIIFNQILDKFDCSCFLENIRDYISQGPDSLHKLQERLLKSLDSSVRDNTLIIDPMNRIQTRFQRKKVVIVLDDVDHKSHLNSLVGDSSWFGNGSRIIFTTRNAELHEETISSYADFYGLEKKEMDSKQSLKFFSRYAFGEDSPPKDFEDLSIEAISTTGGLPLALEVVGSFLHREKAKVWIEMINKLKESPHQDVQRTLMISYNGLEYEQQEIFLDIACFFIDNGEGTLSDNYRTYPIYMWDSYGFYPNHGIQVLIAMSLIKINDRKCFWMHDQLRDFGRAIVKEKYKDHRTCSRLWVHQEALALLRRNEGKEKVEALHLDGPSVYLDRENFVGLEKLRFFRLTKGANFDGDFSGLIPNLRWMSLLIASSFNVTNLYLRELVVLELFRCKFDETWPGWGHILISQQLKVLTLSDCHELISTPDLSKVVNLERLDVKSCVKLTSLHRSVGKLQCLRRLSIIGCGSLHEFPEELSSLESLKHIIFLDWSMRLQLQLQNSIGRLVSLTRLELERVVHLPNSIGELVKLKHLSLRFSLDLRVLPDSIGDLRSLISLDLSYTIINELPNTIGGLRKLKSLCLCSCKELQRLPDSIGNLQSLVDLNMSDCQSIAELPHSFGNLASLQTLNLMGLSVKTLPESIGYLVSLTRLELREVVHLPNSIGELVKLKHLSLRDSPKLRVLPDSIGDLKLLIRLDLSYTVITELPTTIGGLAKLESLYLSSCRELQRLPDSIGKLQSLVDLNMSGCRSITELPHSFGNLASLIHLDLSDTMITELPNTIGKLAKLETLDLSNCVSLQRLPDSLGNLQLLDDLNISGCQAIAELPHSFGNLASLQTLNLAHSSDLRVLPDSIGDLRSLIRLDLSYRMITELPTTIGQLAKLKSLDLSDCKRLQRLPDSIGNLQSMVDLYMFGCRSIAELPHSFGNLASLIRLNLSGTMITELPTTIGQLAKLKSLDLSDCERLQRLPDSIGNLQSLVDLNMSGCRSIAELPHSFGNLASLHTLNLMGLSVRLLPDSIKLKRLGI